MVVNVYVSAVTTDNISRHELLAWVNDCLQSAFSKIEEMSTGAAYCQLTDMLFPGSISLKKVKFNSRNEVDWINNWKALQTSWKTLGVDKPVPVERLLRAKFQENFEFLQWFKKFFDANYEEHEYDANGARGGEPLPSGGKAPAARPGAGAAKAPAARPAAARAPAATAAAPRPAATAARAPAARPAPAKAPATAPAPPPGLIKELEDKVEAYAESTATAERERDFYYARLIRIENLCTAQSNAGDATIAIEAITKILYESVEEEDGVADEGVDAASEQENMVNGKSAEDTFSGPPSPIKDVVPPVVSHVGLLEDDDDETF